MEKQKTRLVKAVIVGDLGVGKTSIMTNIVGRPFSGNYKATIGADFMNHQISDNCTLQIWDTAGQERFRSLGVAFYRGADIAVVVYDVTNRERFINVVDWLKELKMAFGENAENVQYLLIANKTDLENRQVTTSEGEKLALANEMMFIEYSAKESLPAVMLSKMEEMINKL